MSRGLTDEPVQPEVDQDSEVDAIIRELVKGQNMLHDRLVDLERKFDHLTQAESEAADRKRWKRGL